MFDVGRICVKLAGRDANKVCLVVDVLDENYVMIDGQTRRRKCNIIHLEPLEQKIKISKKASHDVVVKELKKAGIAVSEEKVKRTKKTEKKEGKEKAEEPKKEKKKEKPKEKK